MASWLSNETQKKKKKARHDEGRAWEDLPRDVMVEIYKRMEMKDLIVGASLCCKSWYFASKETCLWREVNFTKDCIPVRPRKPTKVIYKRFLDFIVARSGGLLSSVKFPSNAWSQDLIYVAERCSRLKHLDLSCFPAAQVRKASVGIAISKLKELEGMVICDSIISNGSILKLVSENCPNLVKLKFQGELSEATASLISSLFPKLKSLDLSDTTTNREALLVILRCCRELEQLNVSGCGVIHILDEIREIGHRRLKEFEFDGEINAYCSICDEMFEDYQVSYDLPCSHVIGSKHATYIEGTRDVPDVVFPFDLYFDKYEHDSGYIMH